jgi:hypothetical protein
MVRFWTAAITTAGAFGICMVLRVLDAEVWQYMVTLIGVIIIQFAAAHSGKEEN